MSAPVRRFAIVIGRQGLMRVGLVGPFAQREDAQALVDRLNRRMWWLRWLLR